MTSHERSLLVIELQSIYEFLDSLRNQGMLNSARDIAREFVDHVDQWVSQISLTGSDRYPETYRRTRDFSDRRVLVPRRWSDRTYVKGMEPPFPRPFDLEKHDIDYDGRPFNALNRLEEQGFSIHTSDVEGTRHLAADLLLDVATLGRPQVLLVATADFEVASLLRSMRTAGTRTGMVLFSSHAQASRVAAIPDRLLSLGELVASLNSIPTDIRKSRDSVLDLASGFSIEGQLQGNAESIVVNILNKRVADQDSQIGRGKRSSPLKSFPRKAILFLDVLLSLVEYETLPATAARPTVWEAARGELPRHVLGWQRYIEDGILVDVPGEGGNPEASGSGMDAIPASGRFEGLERQEWREGWYLVSGTLLHRAAFAWFYEWVGEQVSQQSGSMSLESIHKLLEQEIEVLRSNTELAPLKENFGFEGIADFLRAIHALGSPLGARSSANSWKIDAHRGAVVDSSGRVPAHQPRPAEVDPLTVESEASSGYDIDFQRLAKFVNEQLGLSIGDITLAALATRVAQEATLALSSKNDWGGAGSFLEMLRIVAARTGQDWELLTDVAPGFIRLKITGREAGARHFGESESLSPSRSAFEVIRLASSDVPADGLELLTLKAAALLTVLGPQSSYSILRTSFSGISQQARDLGNVAGLPGGGRNVYEWVLRGVRGNAPALTGQAANVIESIYGLVIRFLVDCNRRSEADDVEAYPSSPGAYAYSLVRAGAQAVVAALETRNEQERVITAVRERLGLDRTFDDLIQARRGRPIPEADELADSLLEALAERRFTSGADVGLGELTRFAQDLHTERCLFLNGPASPVPDDELEQWRTRIAEGVLDSLRRQEGEPEQQVTIEQIATQREISYADVVTSLAWTERANPEFLKINGWFVEDDIVLPVRLLPKGWEYTEPELDRHSCILAAKDVARKYLAQEVPISWMDVVRFASPALSSEP